MKNLKDNTVAVVFCFGKVAMVYRVKGDSKEIRRCMSMSLEFIEFDDLKKAEAAAEAYKVAETERKEEVAEDTGLPGDDRPTRKDAMADKRAEAIARNNSVIEARRVLNIRAKVVHRSNHRFDVYIGRGNHGANWGNQFTVKDGDKSLQSRIESIQKYREWLYQMIEKHPDKMVPRVADLHGKVLGCWCAPLPCHGDVLAEAAQKCYNKLAEEGKLELLKSVS